MRYFYDTEFIEDGSTIELISIGIVCEDGREYYAVNADMPIDRIRKHEWLVDNVVPSLPLTHAGIWSLPSSGKKSFSLDLCSTLVRPHWVIANEVREFLTTDNSGNELWSYYGAYDHVALCQLWGTMVALPEGVPMFTHELMQLWESVGGPSKPDQDSGEHNALEDARWNQKLWQACQPDSNVA